jgi:UDP-N-acetylmuramate--alanine ligase
MMRKKGQEKIHFIGIGGAGMAPIAEILLNRGVSVSGSDIGSNDCTRRLAEKGATIVQGHNGANVRTASRVVVSSAIRNNNPEWVAAVTKGIPVIHRGEMLAELLNPSFGIAVAGSHGKTTTTSMIASILRLAGLDPTCVVGGRVSTFPGCALIGKSPYFVTEADESDGSFLKLEPRIRVVTNIDREHMDFYGNFETLLEAFASYLDAGITGGLGVLCIDDPGIASLVERLNSVPLTYGLSVDARVRATNILHEGLGSSFDLAVDGTVWGRITLSVPGLHNVLNALAAACVGICLEVETEVIRDALANFVSVGRRFTILGERDGVLVVDDYGHHPTEIRATLSAARLAYPSRRIVAVFQPHRFTRVRDLQNAFVESFGEADRIFVTEIYSAGEDPIPGVAAESLYLKMKDRWGERVDYEPRRERWNSHLQGMVQPGDLVITLGAGDITRLGKDFLSWQPLSLVSPTSDAVSA